MAREPREVILQRERSVWELRQQGWTQNRIATKLGIDQSTVSKVLLRVSKRVAKELSEMVALVKVEQTQQLEHIVDESLQAWQRSKEASKSVTRRTGAPEGAADSEVTQQVKDQDGDVRYLDTAMKAMLDIRKIWGAEAPAKVANTDPTGMKEPSHAATSDDERVARLVAIFDAARARRNQQPGGPSPA